nr:piggyBac transposable element-derived protein 4-like [Procambarus clarkii]
MDRGKGQSTSTPKKDSEMTTEDKLSELYKRFSNVKLTPSKIPDLLDRLSDVEADAEGEERQSDFSSDNEGTASSDEFDSSSSEESSEGIEDEAADVGRPKAPVRRRAGRLQQPNPDAAWSTDNTPPIVGSFSATPGITVPVPITPLQFVQLFLTRALIEFITVETNRYARQFIQNASRRTMRLWKEVSAKEMARYLALSILMGIARLPTMRMYWQTSRLWHMRTFNVFMTAKRFQHIAQFFHTYNQFAIPPNNKNRMIKLSTIITYLTNKFGSYYVPNQALSLDEGTMSWRGRLSFKVYNPNKPDKYGVKLYMLAEAGTGYIIDFEVYSGVGKTTVETVMGLMRPLLNKGYHLYMDNYYNSVHLTELLRENGVYTCGTLRLQRGAPKELQQLAKGKFAVDQTIFRRKDNTFVILWKDKRVVSVITNCHNADTQEVQRRKRVKKRDGTSSVQIMAIHNAYVMYKMYTTDAKKLTLLQFHEVAIWALLRWDMDEWPATESPLPHADDYQDPSHDLATPGPSGARRPLFHRLPRQPHASSSSDTEPETETPAPQAEATPPPVKNPRIVDSEDRLNRKLTHALVKIAKRKRCRVCMKSGIRKDSMYQCRTCGVALCATPCYTKYHRKRIFWKAKK